MKHKDYVKLLPYLRGKFIDITDHCGNVFKEAYVDHNHEQNYLYHTEGTKTRKINIRWIKTIRFT